MLDERFFSAANISIVGNINRDIKISPIPPGNYLFADGETSVTSVTETVGGGGANSALAAAALAARVAFLGRVGADWLGDRLERALTSHGISAYLKTASGCPTGTSVNLTFTSGRRHFLAPSLTMLHWLLRISTFRRWKGLTTCCALTYGFRTPCCTAATRDCSGMRAKPA